MKDLLGMFLSCALYAMPMGMALADRPPQSPTLRVRVALALAAAKRPPQAPAARPPQAPALRQPRSHRPAFDKARELLRRRRIPVPYYLNLAPAPRLMMPMVPMTGFGGFGGAGGC